MYNYTLLLCESDTMLYDDKTVVVYISIPNNMEWEPNLGIIKMTVSSSSDADIGNNQITGGYVPEIRFKYRSSYGRTLTFTSTANLANGIEYVFAVRFFLLDRDIPTFPPLQELQNLITESVPQSSAASWYKPDLLPIPTLTGVGFVPTLKTTYLKFAICPPSSLLVNSLVITAIGTTGTVGLSTYACITPDCSALTEPPNLIGFDITNANVNVVAVTSQSFEKNGLVFLALTGFGGTDINSFRVTARLTYAQ